MHLLTLTKKTNISPLVFSVLLAVPLVALAGPPYETDDPDPTEYKHYEIFVATEYHRSAEERSGTFPNLEVNYGLMPDVQIGINTPIAFSQIDNQNRHYGLGDIELSVKYRFIQETEVMPMVSFFPSYKSHTGNANKNLGNGESEYFLPIWLGKSWGDWTTYGGSGYTITQEDNAKNSWFFGWLLQKQVTKHLNIGGEIFYKSEKSPDEGTSTGFNLGGSYDFNERHHVVFSAGKGLKNVQQTNQFSSFVAYLLTF